MTTADQTCDYIITRLCVDEPEMGTLNVLKLQKLLYYAQAWNLALYEKPLFPGCFEAWVHGPVHRPTYERFRDTKMLYSAVVLSDRRPGFEEESLDKDDRNHLAAVLEVYGGFTDTQLESLTHEEAPWVQARAGLPSDAPGRAIISDDLMRDYYASRIKSDVP